ncbi:MAG TPA: hypothetical protein VFS41_11020, partial [Edaphobacter sp.]|nr:hypothetical protein [Edaphobacter sp.]
LLWQPVGKTRNSLGARSSRVARIVWTGETDKQVINLTFAMGASLNDPSCPFNFCPEASVSTTSTAFGQSHLRVREKNTEAA